MMKKGFLLILLVFFTLTFPSCLHKEGKEQLTGIWLLQESENEPVSPRHAMVLEFLPDGKLTVARISENGPGYSSKWIEYSQTGSWRLFGRRLTLKGRFDYINQLTAKATLDQLDADSMSYTLRGHKTSQLDQMSWRKPFQRKFVKAARSDSLFYGSWDMISLTGHQIDYRFTFNEDHTYYFFQNLDGSWQNIKDYQGSWYAYGNLICINHHFDLFDIERFYEPTVQCFYFSRQEDDGDEIIRLYPDDNDWMGEFKFKRSKGSNTKDE